MTEHVMEYAVQIVDAETVIGTTEPVMSQSNAKSMLAQIKRGYPDSTLVYRPHPTHAWKTATENTLTRLAYQHTASALTAVIGEGLAPIHWDLRPYAPDEIEGTSLGEDPAADVAEYATLLGVKPVEEKTHRDDIVRVTASGMYRGVKVTVSARVPKQQADVDAEQDQDGGDAG